MRTFSKAKLALYGAASTLGVLATSLVCRADADLDAFNASTTLGARAAKSGIFASMGSYTNDLMYLFAGIIGFYLMLKIVKRITGR